MTISFKFAFEPQVGSRVCCIAGMDNDKLLWIGTGTYIGEKVVPWASDFDDFEASVQESAAMNGVIASEEQVKDLYETCFKIPCIKLDNGDIVWANECFWMLDRDLEDFLKLKRHAGFIPVSIIRGEDGKMAGLEFPKGNA